jgi:hypothetical protein
MKSMTARRSAGDDGDVDARAAEDGSGGIERQQAAVDLRLQDAAPREARSDFARRTFSPKAVEMTLARDAGTLRTIESTDQDGERDLDFISSTLNHSR